MSHVDPNAVSGIAAEIRSAANSLKGIIETTKAAGQATRSACGLLGNYNNQKVAGSTYEVTQPAVPATAGNLAREAVTTRYYQTWNITGHTEIEQAVRSLESALATVEDTLTNLTAEASNIDMIAEAIDGYITNIQNSLGDTIDPAALGVAFAGLNSKIAWDEKKASEHEFISEDKILTTYWTDKTLRFEKQSNGTYAIYQKDDQGNEVVMGFTTAMTAAMYLKGLDTVVNPQGENSDNGTKAATNLTDRGFPDSKEGLKNTTDGKEPQKGYTTSQEKFDEMSKTEATGETGAKGTETASNLTDRGFPDSKEGLTNANDGKEPQKGYTTSQEKFDEMSKNEAAGETGAKGTETASNLTDRGFPDSKEGLTNANDGKEPQKGYTTSQESYEASHSTATKEPTTGYTVPNKSVFADSVAKGNDVKVIKGVTIELGDGSSYTSDGSLKFTYNQEQGNYSVVTSTGIEDTVDPQALSKATIHSEF